MKKCPVCGCDCWESNTLRNSLRSGVVKEAACTERALKAMGQLHD
nr:MAG TPA: C2H2 type zinc-finger protein [Caudoviricetes sp.]